MGCPYIMWYVSIGRGYARKTTVKGRPGEAEDQEYMPLLIYKLENIALYIMSMCCIIGTRTRASGWECQRSRSECLPVGICIRDNGRWSNF